MRWTTLLILAVLGLFVVACFPGDSQEEPVSQAEPAPASNVQQPSEPVAADTSVEPATSQDGGSNTQQNMQPTPVPQAVTAPAQP